MYVYSNVAAYILILGSWVPPRLWPLVGFSPEPVFLKVNFKIIRVLIIESSIFWIGLRK
jgi:hypothetical protein